MALLLFATLFLIISALALIVALLWFVVLLVYKAPYVKTPDSAVEALLENIQIKPGDRVYDLGCGDASVLIAVEKKFRCATVGYESSPFTYLRSFINVWRSRSRARIYWGNFFKANLRNADLVFCFLIQSLMSRVGVYLGEQLKPGARVICYGYPIPCWQPVRTIDVTGTTSKLYIYQR